MFCDNIVHEFSEIMQNKGHYDVQRYSRSSASPASIDAHWVQLSLVESQSAGLKYST